MPCLFFFMGRKSLLCNSTRLINHSCTCQLQLLFRLLAVLTSHCLMTCHGFPTHVPITVCELLMPFHYAPDLPAPSQPLNTSPYLIHVSSTNYTRDSMLTVTVNGTKGIKVRLKFICFENNSNNTHFSLLKCRSKYLFSHTECHLSATQESSCTLLTTRNKNWKQGQGHIEIKLQTKKAWSWMILNHFQGFIIQARAVGDPRPVGTFQGNLLEDQTYMWCSGGEPQVHEL